MTCEECGVGLVEQSKWHKATDEQRANWKALKWAPYAGRGLCRSCYQRAYRRTFGFIRPEPQEASR
jgi:hypothetical protein